MGKGRPIYSQVRANMVEILYAKGKGYGYEIAKIYLDIFPRVTKRLFYYHLKKGVELGEFKIESIEKEEGDFSWGSTVEKIYYVLGENAMPKGNKEIIEYLTKKKMEEKDNGANHAQRD
jgi:hypothetical protein